MNTLLTCIKKETLAMAELVEVLQQEQGALTQAPNLELMEEISALTQKKNRLINTLSELSQVRNSELVRLGFKATQSSIPEWLQNQEQTVRWNELIEQTKRANDLNRQNGILINRHLTRNQSTLEVLYKNHHNNNAPTLYGANGQSDTQRNTVRGVVA